MYQNKNLIFAIAWGCIALLPSKLLAASSVVTGSFGISYTDFHYEEKDTASRVLDREEGNLPGVELGFRWDHDAGFLRGDLSYQQAEVDYVAFPNAGSSQLSNTDEKITVISLLAGRVFAPSQRLNIEVYGGLGFWYWSRNIQSSPRALGLDEDYDWTFLQLGLQPELQLSAKTSIGIDLTLRKVVDANLRVKFANGVYDTTKLKLDNGYGFRLALDWHYKVNDGFGITAGPYFELWEFDPSRKVDLRRGNVLLGSLHEPESMMKSVGFRLSVNKRF